MALKSQCLRFQRTTMIGKWYHTGLGQFFLPVLGMQPRTCPCYSTVLLITCIYTTVAQLTLTSYSLYVPHTPHLFVGKRAKSHPYFIYLLCALVFGLHICLCEGVRPLTTEITDICKLTCGCWALNPSSLENHPLLLTTEQYAGRFSVSSFPLQGLPVHHP